MRNEQLVRVVRGSVFDVTVDVRRNSRASAANGWALGLSHDQSPPALAAARLRAPGFIVTSDSADFTLQTTGLRTARRLGALGRPAPGHRLAEGRLPPTLSGKDAAALLDGPRPSPERLTFASPIPPDTPRVDLVAGAAELR